MSRLGVWREEKNIRKFQRFEFLLSGNNEVLGQSPRCGATAVKMTDKWHSEMSPNYLLLFEMLYLNDEY